MRLIHLPAVAALALAAATALPAPAFAGIGGYDAAGGLVWSKLVPAPAFRLTPVAGGAGDLKAYAGKVRIIDFWATWCPPCRKEIPGFVALQAKYKKQGLAVIGVSVDDGPEPVKAFMQANGVNYPVLMADGAVQQAYGGIRGIPTTFIVGRKGYIYKKYVGGYDASVFEADVLSLL